MSEQMPRELEELRDELAEKYQDEDFKQNPDGYTVAPYVNSETTSAAFEAGFNAAYQALSARVKELERQLNEYESMRREEQLARHAAQDRCKELEDKCARAWKQTKRLMDQIKSLGIVPVSVEGGEASG